MATIDWPRAAELEASKQAAWQAYVDARDAWVEFWEATPE